MPVSKFVFVPAFALAALVLGPAAQADVITINLNDYNSALSSWTGTAATVTVNRTDTTHATVTFTSQTNTGPGGTFQVLMGDGGTADLNVSGAYLLGTVTEANSITGFTPSFKDNTPGVVDGFGSFNLSLNNNDGFMDSATSIVIALTATGANSWAAAADVLTPNGNGATAAIHDFECGPLPCTTATGALATGFVANGGAINTPEPASLGLLGTAFVGLGLLRRRRR